MRSRRESDNIRRVELHALVERELKDARLMLRGNEPALALLPLPNRICSEPAGVGDINQTKETHRAYRRRFVELNRCHYGKSV